MNITFAKRMLPLLALTVATALLVALSLDNRRLRTSYTELYRRSLDLHPGLAVPGFQALGVEGGDLTIGSPAQGQQQVLFFFTTSCPYCLASIPDMRRIADAVARDTRTAIYGVALDSLAAVRRYIVEHQLAFPIAVVSDRRTAELYRVRRVPQLTIVGGDGRVLYSRHGVIDDPAAVDSVLSVLGAVAPAAEMTSGSPEHPPPSNGR